MQLLLISEVPLFLSISGAAHYQVPHPAALKVKSRILKQSRSARDAALSSLPTGSISRLLNGLYRQTDESKEQDYGIFYLHPLYSQQKLILHTVSAQSSPLSEMFGLENVIDGWLRDFYSGIWFFTFVGAFLMSVPLLMIDTSQVNKTR